MTLSSTPASQFTDGDYVVTIHNTASANAVVGELAWRCTTGAMTHRCSPRRRAAADPWATALPGSYPAGTAGAILGTNLDAKVSSRSTYAGGPVASVTAPVTVGRTTTRPGTRSRSAGLDAIQVEPG